MFDSFFDNEILKEGAVIPKPKKVEITLLDDPEVYPSIYKERLANLDTMTDEEIYKSVAPSLSFILKKIMNGEDNREDIKYFTNARFLNAAINTVARSTNLNFNDIIAINTIAIEYLNYDNRDANIIQLMRELVRVTNRNYIERLTCMTGMSTDDAINISMSFLASGDGLANILRVNNILVKLPDDIATEQKFICIYETFTESGLLRMRDLFKSIMFDYGIININNSNENEKFSILINSILNILNSQPSNTIRFVLIEYYNEWTFTRKPIRFPILSLSRDYSRILDISNALKLEGIIIP